MSQARKRKKTLRRRRATKNKPRGKPFPPGNQAAKGHGRPPLPPEYKLAMEDLGPRGLQALANIIEDPTYPRHEQACEYVVNRWKGTPTTRIEQSGPGGGPIAVKTVLTSDEKRARIRALEEAARERLGDMQEQEADPDDVEEDGEPE